MPKNKNKAPIKYGDYEAKSDDWLIKARERLMDYLEKGHKQEYIDALHELMEVERELTLREDR